MLHRPAGAGLALLALGACAALTDTAKTVEVGYSHGEGDSRGRWDGDLDTGWISVRPLAWLEEPVPAPLPRPEPIAAPEPRPVTAPVPVPSSAPSGKPDWTSIITALGIVASGLVAYWQRRPIVGAARTVKEWCSSTKET